MITFRPRHLLLLVAGAAVLAAGAAAPVAGAEGSPGSGSLALPTTTTVQRTMPNGKTDVIKVMGNTKWCDIELKDCGQKK